MTSINREAPPPRESLANDGPERLALRSRDLAADRIAQLRQLFPEVFREDAIDFDALRRSLGDWVEPERERFGLTWPGKANCMRIIQQPSVGTLIPNREQSLDSKNTQNVVIEGDNLEVLKLLQNSYHAKVKMIYIDPPYNTGNNYIYPDNYTEPLNDYLRYTGQIDDKGKKQTTNGESSGRYHSNWLNMMHPRLFLARNLLGEDGVIFISIDDSESDNLRLLGDEIFGEENFVAQIVWQKKYGPANDAKHFSETHDYILVYARSLENWRPNLLDRSDEQLSDYKNPDHDPRGAWRASDLSVRTMSQGNVYDIELPSGERVRPPASRSWVVTRERYQELLADNRISFGSTGTGRPMLKRFLADVKAGITPQTWWPREFAGDNKIARYEIKDLFPDNVFDTPKPIRLVERMLEVSTSKDSVVLDFFAGSGTTGHAVMKLNAEDGGNRRYILVQLPEPVDNGGPFRTISEITRERLRRAGTQIREQAAKDGRDVSGLDTGFQAYSLAESNFRQWQGDTSSPEYRDGQLGLLDTIEQQLKLLKDNVREDRSPRAILTELMLAAGKSLTEPVAKIKVADQHAWSIAGGTLLICLERRIQLATVQAMAERDPEQIICLDASFVGDDKLRVNAAQTIRSWARQHQRTIAFRVV